LSKVKKGAKGVQLKQLDLHQLRVHRTLSDAQAGASTNSLLSGIAKDVTAKIHQTVRWANIVRANGQQRNQRAINE
jgi:hypothetical protein